MIQLPVHGFCNVFLSTIKHYGTESDILQVSGAFHSLRYFTVSCWPPRFCQTGFSQRQLESPLNVRNICTLSPVHVLSVH